MEDVGKAMLVTTQVLLFLFAISISVPLYQKFMGSIDNIFLSSNYSNRGDSIIGDEIKDTTRVVDRSEVVVSIMNLKSEPSGSSVIVTMNGSDKYTFKYNFEDEHYVVKTPAGTSLDLYESADPDGTYQGMYRYFISEKNPFMLFPEGCQFKLSYTNGKSLKYTQI